MFDFFKKIFVAGEPRTVEVAIKEVSQWFSTQTKPLFEDLNKKIKLKFNEIEEELSVFQQNIIHLENAKSIEENIEPRVKQVVMGNRDNYVKQMAIFLDKIEVPVDIDYSNALNYCTLVMDELNNLGRTTEKSYYTAQHLFFNDVEAVANNIKNLDKLISDVRVLVEEGKITSIENVNMMIDNFHNKIKRKDGLSFEISQEGFKLKDLKQKKDDVDKKLQNLKLSEDFNKLELLKEDRDTKAAYVKELENDVYHLFSPLEKAFKKYERIAVSDESTANGYAFFPLKTLVEDKELMIIETLQNIKKNVESNAIELNDKKKDKTLEVINSITKESLSKLRNEYLGGKDKKEEMDRKIVMSPVSQSIKELSYKQENLGERILAVESFVEGLNRDFNKIDIDELKSSLQTQLSESIKANIILK